jgi:hypothetical protein
MRGEQSGSGGPGFYTELADQNKAVAVDSSPSTTASSKVGRPRPDDDHLRMRRTKPQRLRPIVMLLYKSL